MSGWGIVAAGLAGGANAVGDITKGMIDQDRRLQSAQAIADMEELKQQRLAEFSEQLRQKGAIEDATGAVGRARTEAAGALARQGNAIALEGEEARAGSGKIRQGKVDDLTAANDAQKKITIANAADPIYIGAVKTLKLADPEVAQRIAASRAQVAEAGARVGLVNAQTEGVNLSNADKKQLDKLYASAGEILSDTTIDDTVRAKRYTDVQRQIVLMKSKNGQVAARDPELDTQTVTTEAMDDKGNVTKTTRKEVRRPGTPDAVRPGGGPAVGTEVDGFVFKGGNPNDKANWEQKRSGAQTRKDPLSGDMLTEPEWDRKYGKGDFKKMYARGEDSLTSF